MLCVKPLIVNTPHTAGVGLFDGDIYKQRGAGYRLCDSDAMARTGWGIPDRPAGIWLKSGGKTRRTQ